MKTTRVKRNIFFTIYFLRTVTPHNMDTKNYGSLRTGLCCFHVGDTVHKPPSTKNDKPFSITSLGEMVLTQWLYTKRYICTRFDATLIQTTMYNQKKKTVSKGMLRLKLSKDTTDKRNEKCAKKQWQSTDAIVRCSKFFRTNKYTVRLKQNVSFSHKIFI